MAYTVLISDMVAQVRFNSDMVNTQFVTDNEIISYLDKAYRDMYIRIVEQNSGYFQTKVTMAIVPGQDTYALPADLYKLCGIDLNLDTQNTITITNINFNERNMLKSVYSSICLSRGWRYLISGENIIFSPAPDVSAGFNVWYIPDPAPIVPPTSLVPAPTVTLTPSVVYDYLIVSAAIKCLQKSESDYSDMANERGIMAEQIMRACASQDDAFPLKVTDMAVINDQFLINPMIWR